MKTILEVAIVMWLITLMAITGLGLITALYGEFKESDLYHDFFEKRGDEE